jgi:hypothetical protein
MFLAMPRDKDMLATFVHALAFFPCNSPRQGHVGNVRSCLGFSRTCWQRSFMPWLIFLAIPRDKDMLATFVHALGLFFLAIPRDKDMLATFVHALAFFPCNSPRQGHVGNVRSCLGAFFPCNSPRQGHVGNVRSCLRHFFSPFLP